VTFRHGEVPCFFKLGSCFNLFFKKLLSFLFFIHLPRWPSLDTVKSPVSLNLVHVLIFFRNFFLKKFYSFAWRPSSDTVKSPVSLNLVHVLVFFRNFYLFLFLMCFLFLLLFCIIKIKCFFFIFIFCFIWMHFGWQRCIQILWRKWSEVGRNTLRWKKVGNLVRIFGGTHGKQQQDWQCWSTQHIDFHVKRAPGMVGSDKKKFFHLLFARTY